MPGVPAPLADRAGIDFIVRENTEGEYSSIGGDVPDTDREFVIQESVFAAGVDRVLNMP